MLIHYINYYHTEEQSVVEYYFINTIIEINNNGVDLNSNKSIKVS